MEGWVAAASTSLRSHAYSRLHTATRLRASAPLHSPANQRLSAATRIHISTRPRSPPSLRSPAHHLSFFRGLAARNVSTPSTQRTTVARPHRVALYAESSAAAEAPVLNQKTQGVRLTTELSRVSVPPRRTRCATPASPRTPKPARTHNQRRGSAGHPVEAAATNRDRRLYATPRIHVSSRPRSPASLRNHAPLRSPPHPRLSAATSLPVPLTGVFTQSRASAQPRESAPLRGPPHPRLYAATRIRVSTQPPVSAPPHSHASLRSPAHRLSFFRGLAARRVFHERAGTFKDRLPRVLLRLD